MGLLIITILFVLLQYVASQDADCDYGQNVQPNTIYYVYSPGFPQSYPRGKQCRWIGTTPSGYQNLLECLYIDMPASQGCTDDRLLISASGDPQLAGANVYCGRGSTTVVSTKQRISIGLITAKTSPGGRFNCTLQAKLITPTPAPCSCGYKKNNRIVGGVETGVNEFPMMAGIVDLQVNSIKCGGTIIDKRYVLTAAHCVVGKTVRDVAVVVGEHDVNTGDSPATQGINVRRILIHPQFTSSNYDYDISILELTQDIVFSDRVGPACLPFRFSDSNFAGATVTMLGWGTIFIGGPTSNTLQKVDVQVISQDSCRSAQPSVTARQMCTYTPGKDACQDDSGGPLLYTDPSTGLLYSVGIISFGRFCAGNNQPGINTRVTALLPWIVANTPSVAYCRK